MCNIRCIRYITGRIWIRWMYSSCWHMYCKCDWLQSSVSTERIWNALFPVWCFLCKPFSFCSMSLQLCVCMRWNSVIYCCYWWLLSVQCCCWPLEGRIPHGEMLNVDGCWSSVCSCVLLLLGPLEIFSGVVCAIYVLAYCFLVDLERRLLNTKC